MTVICLIMSHDGNMSHYGVSLYHDSNIIIMILVPWFGNMSHYGSMLVICLIMVYVWLINVVC